MADALRLETFMELRLGSPAGQFRAVPVKLGSGGPPAFFAAYAADFDVDPWVEMFYLPTDTLKLTVFTGAGEVLWKKDLGRGVVPGMHFVPICALDLDGDGVDELWFVNNVSAHHPLSLRSYRLERLDARTGRTLGQWPWPDLGGEQSLSSSFRNFIRGGRARGEPVLVTAQGTYGPMFLQGWRPEMTARWAREIGRDAPGARGSHMAQVVDLNRDGVDELLWGERVIELDGGRQLFCMDEDAYRGHSDVVEPVLDEASGRWFVYTCRESDNRVSPRVALFDDQGGRVWGRVERGHMDMGWVARLGDSGKTAMAARIDAKTCGPDGRHHEGVECFTWDVFSGSERAVAFDPYRTIPVDLNGDGRHELVRGVPGGDGAVHDRHGRPCGKVEGTVALARKMLGRPGEQVLVYLPDGTVRVVGDAAAEDGAAARARYANPYYRANAWAVGGV